MVTAAVYFQTRHYGLLGFDTYPLIASEHVESVADLWRLFSERVGDGYFRGLFYRPVFQLSFALDHALWGLAPSGYQLTNAALFAFCALGLYAFLATRPVPRPPAAAIAGTALFLFHPLVFEVIPFPCRRSDFLCGGLMLLALATESRASNSSRVLGVILTVLAAASKETAILLPPLVLVYALAYSKIDAPLPRLAAALRRAGVSLAVVGLFWGIRALVLGGLGGYSGGASPELLRNFPEILARLARSMASPSSPESWMPLGAWLTITGALALLCVRRSSGAREWRGALPADAIFALSWIGGLAAAVALAGRYSPWHSTMGLPAVSILLAGQVESLIRLVRERRNGFRALGIASAFALGALWTGWQARWSPLLRPYGVWRQATEAGSRYLEGLAETIAATEPGTVVSFPAPPREVTGDSGEPLFHGVFVLRHYSLEAWAELAYPKGRVRIAKDRRPRAPADDEIVVLLDRRSTVDRRP